MAYLVPCTYAFGIPDEDKIGAPIANLPEETESVRFRFRNDQFGKLFVKTKSGVQCFIPEFVEGMWWIDPEMEQGRNLTYEH